MTYFLRLGLVVPALAVYLFGFIAPLAMMSYASFLQADPGPAADVVSLANFRAIIADRVYLAAFANTLMMSLSVAAIAALLAYPLCIYLSSIQGARRNLILIAIIAPLLVSVVVRTLGWQLLLGPRGVIDQLFGVQLLYTNLAVLIGLVHLFLAHMVLALLSVLGSIKKEIIHAARTLGCGEFRIFLRIILPLSLPGLLAGFVITFGASAGALITPLFLGGARVNIASMEIYRTALVFFNWPLASALSVALLGINFLVIFAIEWLLRKSAKGVAL